MSKQKSEKDLFDDFLYAAGFKFANMTEALGGAGKDTPDDRVVLMLVGDNRIEYNLVKAGISFEFDYDDNFVAIT